MVRKRLTNLAQKRRRNPTEAEKRLWSHLRAKQLGVQFTREFQIGNYMVDLACRRARLVIELDGGQHAESEAERQCWRWCTPTQPSPSRARAFSLGLFPPFTYCRRKFLLHHCENFLFNAAAIGCCSSTERFRDMRLKINFVHCHWPNLSAPAHTTTA